MGTLYIVATPIGNLRDITIRALKTLKEVDVILCEDTRVTKKLLVRYSIEKPLLSYHQHSKEDRAQEILDMILRGKNLALVTDAGTPGVSDPGNELIAFLLRKHPDVKIVPIPGPSALTAIASIAGMPMDRFLFLGYPPHKKGRVSFFQEVAKSERPVVFYESPHRIVKSLRELLLRGTFRVVVARELTKQFETIYRGTADEILQELAKKPLKGELVVVVYQEK